MQGRVENLLGALALALDDEVQSRTEAVAGHGPSAPATLVALLRRPDQSIERLRHSAGLSHSATVRLVDRLERDKLVIRRSAQDGRAVSLALSARGRRITLRLLQERRGVLSRALAGLSELDRRQLESLLEAMLRTQSRTRPDPTPVCRLCELSVCPLRRCPVPGGR
ncbi:MAG: MarR family winged helix-turn-helix transcriptional regulator [Acidimicrobiales bacterium]|nr:MarR family winged helix-turn-helix transcriptional regulator [Acidimicrobiales bacterium]